VRVGNEDAFSKIIAEPVHDAEHHDQRGDAYRHSTGRNDRVE
jgi:hypothetical protein